MTILWICIFVEDECFKRWGTLWNFYSLEQTMLGDSRFEYCWVNCKYFNIDLLCAAITHDIARQCSLIMLYWTYST